MIQVIGLTDECHPILNSNQLAWSIQDKIREETKCPIVHYSWIEKGRKDLWDQWYTNSKKWKMWQTKLIEGAAKSFLFGYEISAVKNL